ncbi:MAG: hypothetical protein FD166_3231 [Bacteroidetes bacterium]|nr:MAG: hypothetical protein FD166_3231 [Bacteroidota bacterium]
MKNLFILLFLTAGLGAWSQVAINADGSLPNSSAMLDVKSTSRGLLLPRMTAAQRDAIVSPATGLLIFCTDNGFYYSNNGTPATPDWVIVNSQWQSDANGIYYSGGRVGIGTAPTIYNLEVQGSYPFQRIKATYGWAGIAIDKAAATDNGYLVHQQGGIDLWAEGTVGDNNFCIRNWGLASDAMNVNWANNKVIFSGKVGVKTDPAYDLHINSSDYTAGHITTPYNGCTAFEVIATSTSAGTWALYSYASAAGYAAYFSGNVYCSGTYLPSDEKLKDNIQPMKNSLDKIMQLDVMTYNYKTSGFPELNLPSDRQNGFTAQNLESVFPELVKLNPAKKEQPVDFKAVNYTGLIPVLTKAVQEQQAMIENLENLNAELVKRIEKLESR